MSAIRPLVAPSGPCPMAPLLYIMALAPTATLSWPVEIIKKR